MDRVVYLDNAATSWPKPEAVYTEADRFFRQDAANPGRGTHAMARRAAAAVDRTRRLVAELFGCSHPSRVTFGPGATDALNTALKGLLGPGERVLTTTLEHNSVVRPLHRMRGSHGTQWLTVPGDAAGVMDLEALEQQLSARPTRLVVVNHASNVTGVIQPLAEIAKLAHAQGALIAVDTAQTAGVVPFSMSRDGIDLVAFSGHKGLLGPMGTGGLVVGPEVSLSPLREGGTGSASEQATQPRQLPHRLESGTLNAGGIAALGTSIKWLLDKGIETLGRREAQLGQRLAATLGGLDGVSVVGRPAPNDETSHVGVVSFSLENLDAAEAETILDQRFGIAVRAGLHCAPHAHKALGSFPGGTIRASVGPFTTDNHIDGLVEAVKELTTIAPAEPV